MTSYLRHSGQEHSHYSRGYTPDDQNLSQRRESRNSRSPQLGRISVSISNPSSPHTSQRNSAVQDYRRSTSRYHSRDFNPHQGGSQPQNIVTHGTSEVDELRMERVKGDLKGVRSDLEALKGYYDGLERLEKQKGYSRSVCSSKVGTKSGRSFGHVVERDRYSVPLGDAGYNSAKFQHTYSPVQSFSYKPQSTYSYAPSHSTHTSLAKPITYPTYQPQRATSVFPEISTSEKRFEKDFSIQKHEAKGYISDYRNLYRGFYPNQTFEPIETYTSKTYENPRISRSKSTLPEPRTHVLLSTPTDYSYKPPSRDIGLESHYHHPLSLLTPHHTRSQSYSSQMIYDLNKLDNSLMTKNLSQNLSFYQPITPTVQTFHEYVPHTSRKSTVLSTTSHASPYKDDSFLKHQEISLAPFKPIESRAMSLNRYDYSSNSFPTNQSLSHKRPSLYSPPSVHNEVLLEDYTPFYKKPPKIATIAPHHLYHNRPPIHPPRSPYNHQSNQISTHNIVFDTASTDQNNRSFIKDFSKRQIHTVQSVTDQTESSYKPKIFNNNKLTTINYNNTFTPIKRSYSRYSTAPPINHPQPQKMSHQEKDLLFKRYTVYDIHTDKDTHKQMEATVGTKLVHIKPRRYSEVHINTHNNTHNKAYNQFNNPYRNKMMSFNVGNENNSNSWALVSGNSQQHNHPQNNRDYHDAHFFDARNPQNVITPPTRVTAPQAYVKKRG